MCYGLEKRGYILKCYTKMEGKQQRLRSRIRWIDPIRKDIEVRGENCEEIKKTGIGRIEAAGNFSVIIDPYFWKLLKIHHDDDFRIVIVFLDFEGSIYLELKLLSSNNLPVASLLQNSQRMYMRKLFKKKGPADLEFSVDNVLSVDRKEIFGWTS